MFIHLKLTEKLFNPFIEGTDFRRNIGIQMKRKELTKAFDDFNPYSAGIDFSRQNLTSVDVRF